MSVDEYAELQLRFGSSLVQRQGVYWRRVRRGFYRPLLAYEPLAGGSEVAAPCGWPGGFQHVVPEGSAANSTLNFIMLGNQADYTLASLNHKRRALVKSATKHFRVEQLHDAQRLRAEGYNAFLSFHERTGYSYRADRTNRPAFEQWADTLFSQPKVFVLGAIGPEGLVGVSCSYWVNATLIFATLFCETQALRKNVGELMFHELRERSAKQPGIQQIFMRPYQGGNSLDQYYLMRGCELVRKPARLRLPAVTETLLRRLWPAKYAMMVGGDA